MAKRVFKTKKKLSGGPKTFRKWGDWSEGDVIIGTFIGTHTDQYDKVCPIIKIEEATFAKKAEAKKLAGQNLVLNSAGQLDKAFEDLPEGSLVQITYNGTSVIEKGKYKGKDAHLIEVDLVEEEGAESEEDQDLEETDSDDEDESDDGDEDSEEEYDV